MPHITLPYRYEPRRYQLPVLRALDAGATRAVAVWHCRSGKEKTFVNFTAKRACQRVGTYFYLFPTYTQAKKAVWDGRDRDGFPFLGHFPPAILAGKNESEMKLSLTNGSIVQFVGSDNIDSLMSTNPIGCVFAEYALQDPRAWDYMRPILRENGGWAVFDYTRRGKNHGYDLFNLASRLVEEGDPAWFVQRLTVDDTGVLSPADIEAERREGMDEDLIQQEFYCSFEGAQQGSYYGREMNQAESEGRITRVTYQAEVAVDTWWDLGIDDATAIWFTQNVGREIHVIDYYENSGEGLPHYAKVLQERGYMYGTHNAPHDIRVRELGTGKSRLETAAALGIRFATVPSIPLADGIEAARSFIPRCWFDRQKTERGRLALVSYHKTWDDKRRCFSSAPYHDWSEHGASGFRYLAVGHKVQGSRFRLAQERPPAVHSSPSSNAWLGA
jgi:phage terminase large subunit